MGSISAGDADLIKKTWGSVKADAKGNGVKYFCSLFTAHPELQAKVPHLAGKSMAELKADPKVEFLATTFIGEVDSYVSGISNTSVMVSRGKAIAESHKVKFGMAASDFKKAYPIVIKFLGDTAGGAWSDGAKGAWEKLFDIFHTGIVSGM